MPVLNKRGLYKYITVWPWQYPWANPKGLDSSAVMRIGTLDQVDPRVSLAGLEVSAELGAFSLNDVDCWLHVRLVDPLVADMQNLRQQDSPSLATEHGQQISQLKWSRRENIKVSFKEP